MNYLVVCLLILINLVSTARAQQVQLDTDAGPIIVKLYADKAPVTVANFLRYVADKRYDGAQFYRVVRIDNQGNSPIKIEVVQGGLYTDTTRMLPPIAQETTAKTGLTHLDGTLSMARSSPNSGSSEFFICINPQPELNFGGKRNPDGQGFAAFGQVISGMDVVRAIQAGETGSPGSSTQQLLRKPVLIRTARLIR